MSARAARLAADQRVRYVFAGGIGALCYYGLFAAGWLAAGRAVPYLIVAAAASTMTAVLTYPIYRRLVFRATGPWLRGFLKFYVVCVWALVFNLAGLWTLVDVLGLHPLIGQAIVITLGPLINYQASRLWAFRRPAAVERPAGPSPADPDRTVVADDQLMGPRHAR